ncbi:MAG: FkbM family methyltransferase [Bauldia litoralis]
MDERFAGNIGTRCEVLVHCISETPDTGGDISEVTFTGTDPCIISPYALLDDFDLKSTFQPHYGNLANFSNYFRKYDYKVYAPSNADYVALENELQSRPNTGFAGILTLLSFEPSALFVTGFTFFAGGYHTSYRQETEHDVLSKMAESGFHNQTAQLDYFATRVVGNSRLIIDDALAEIVNRHLLARTREADTKVNIVGNGPSLKDFPFRTLRDRVTVSFNRAYIIYEKENFYPSIYVCVDKVVLLNCLKDIEGLLESPIQRFVLLDCPETAHLAGHPKVELVARTKKNAGFFGDVATFALHHLMQAGYRDFDVYGCDCSYIEDIEKLNVDVEKNADDPARRIVLKPRKGAADPNHFLPEYFGEGTEYSVPREANHYKCWQSVRQGAKDTGTTLTFRTPSKVSDLFAFSPVEETTATAVPDGVLPPPRQYEAPASFATTAFEREDTVQIDEVRLVYELVGSRPDGVMLDVGAHFGVTLSRFAAAGWRVFAFEPDPSNRLILNEAVEGKSNVVVSEEAVSDVSGQKVPFFASDESTGVSGLSSFLDSHHEVARVKTVTLDDVVSRHGLTSVDFLKIDVEGFEMAVLRGLDFDKVAPGVVVAEFEDQKTEEHGYTADDLCRFFVKRGYVVYVSEWFPIERYGAKHSFRRLRSYPCRISRESWGNLIAFKQAPDGEDMRRAARLSINERVGFQGDDLGSRPPVRDAVVVGNGPSLKGFDFARLKRFDTIGMNAAYRHWYAIKWFPQYYACLDTVVGMSHRDAIARMIEDAEKLGIRAFLLRRDLITALGETGKSPRVVDFDGIRNRSPALQSEPVTTGSHTCAWASYLGYRNIYLLGVDGDYVPVVEGAEKKEGIILEIVEEKDNANYYFAGYQQVGDRYNLPNPSKDLHLRSWRNVAKALEGDQSRVVNANPSSKVDSFPVVSFNEAEKALEIPASNAAKKTGPGAADSSKKKRRKGGKGGAKDRGRAQAPRRGGKTKKKPVAQGRHTVSQKRGKARRRPSKANKRGFIAGFLRSNPIAAAAILLGVIFLIVVAILPDRAVAIDLLGRAGPLVLLGVVVAVAYDRLGRRMRVRIFRAERQAARRTDRLRRKIGRLHKTSVAQRNRQREQRRLAETARRDLTRSIDTQIGALKLGQEADRASVNTDIGEIRKSVQRLAERDVSIDVVSALRQLRGLIFPGNADVDIDGDESIEHGHRELMAVLAKEALNKPGSMAGKTLVEVGTTRERVDGQGSTQKLAVFTAMLGMRFVSVDMDPENTESADPVVKLLNPAAVVVTAKGEDYLAAMDAPIDYVYLDAFDFDHKGHSARRRERYKRNLGVDIVDEACWLMHLQCAYAIAEKMAKGGIVTIDDTWTDTEGEFAGKGKLAVPFLLTKGFEIVSRTASVTLRRTGNSSTDAE